MEVGLAQYTATTHVVGGQVVELAGDEASGTTTCLAHHVYAGSEGERLLVMAICYRDRYHRRNGRWRFSERRLELQWSDDRPLAGRR
jgi:hypothetical protein